MKQATLVHFRSRLSFKIAFYSTNMFIGIGLDPNTWAVYATIVIDCFKVLITVVCLLLIEVSGRRKLLITGLSGMVVSCLGLAIFPDIPVLGFQSRQKILSIFDNLFPKSSNDTLKYLTVASAVFYVIFFSIGPGNLNEMKRPHLGNIWFALVEGAIPWLITSELFASDARGKATSIAIFVHYLSNFIVSTSTPIIMVWKSCCFGLFLKSVICFWTNQGIDQQFDLFVVWNFEYFFHRVHLP